MDRTMSSPEYLYFSSMSAASKTLAEEIVSVCKAEIAKKGFCVIALSGGNTPRYLYKELAENYTKEVFWKKVYFFFSDERIVSKNSLDSNFNTAYAELFIKLAINADQIFSFSDDRLYSKTAASEYENMIRDFFAKRNMKIEFDIILLGMGSDGHTASLFPQNAACNEQKTLVTHVSENENIKHNRITFTFPLINSSKNVFFLTSKNRKEDAFLKLSEKAVPASKVCAKKTVWYISE